MNYSENLLSIRQKIITIFKNYEKIIIPTFKFITIFACISILQNIIGYTGKLSSFAIVALISAVGTMVSAETIVLGSILLISFFMMSTDLVLGLIVFGVLVVLYFGFMRFFPRESIYTIVTIIAFAFNIPSIVPIIAAIVSGYASIFAIILGIIIWFIVPGIKPLISDMPMDLSKLTEWAGSLQEANLESVLLNRQMLIVIVVFFIVFSVIYIIRKQSLEYAPYVAIVIGAVMNILGFGMAKLFFDDFALGLLSAIICSVIGAILGTIIQFLSVVLDYSRTENVQFEDEDNYYYVKVVPKISIVSKKSTVKHVYTNNEDSININDIFLEPNKTSRE